MFKPRDKIKKLIMPVSIIKSGNSYGFLVQPDLIISKPKINFFETSYLKDLVQNNVDFQ